MKTDMSDIQEIKETAASWLVRVDSGELTEAESTELKTWLQSSEFHRRYFRELTRNWEIFEALAPMAELYPLPPLKKEAVAPAGAATSSWIDKFRSTPAFAAYALTIMLVVIFIRQPQPVESYAYQTAPGQHSTYTLSDGSVVSLNTNTKLQITFTRDTREIKLVYGEGNFAVAKNKSRPFLVKAGDGAVVAVGTAFDVRYAGTDVDVIVSEGTVKVFSEAPSPDKLELTATNLNAKTEALVSAGNSISYNKVVTQVAPLDQRSLLNKLAWLKGNLIFDGETLEQVIAEVSRYTDKKIIIKDEQLKQLKVGGHFSTNNLDELLYALGKSFHINIKKQGENQIELTQGQ